MKKDEFVKTVCELIMKELGDLYVAIPTEEKHRDGTVESYVKIYEKGKEASCSLFSFDNIYALEKEHPDFNYIASLIVKQYLQESDINTVNKLFFWENAQDKILPVLLNPVLEVVENRPVRNLRDLFVGYHMFVQFSEDHKGYISVTDLFVDAWNVDEESLYVNAIANMQTLLMPEINPLSRIYKKLGLPLLEPILENKDLYVLASALPGNKYAAACVLDSDLLNAFSELIGCGFWMIPVSKHEWILIPEDYNMEYEEINTLLMFSNANCVEKDDMLGTHPYFYSIQKESWI